MNLFKPKYYSLSEIDKTGAKYRMVIGGRSNGKTFAALEKIVKNYAKTGKQGAIIRRWDDDLKAKNGKQMFAALIDNGIISRETGGEWTTVYYIGRLWFFARETQDSKGNTKIEKDSTPFCFGFSLSDVEHDKSVAYPGVTTVVFDEFLTRLFYMPDEFVIFSNVLSTIIRERTDVVIYMLGNTVNKYCPYFAEMGLRRIRDMKPGSIDVYTYGNSGLTVAVEYSKPLQKSKQSSDVYFAFDNPRLKMITTGDWEIDLYPHCPIKYREKDILFTYFIVFDDQCLQCEIVAKDGLFFTFIHPKTTPLRNESRDLIFCNRYDARPNWRRKISVVSDDIGGKIYRFFLDEKVFYSDNETGEVIANYLKWCKTA